MGSQQFKISLSGYDATTDTDPNHFSLYVDQLVDYILIKEKTRGSRSVAGLGNSTVAHGLGYIPFVLVFYESSTNVFRKVHGATDPSASNPYFELDATNLTLRNPTVTTTLMKYYIFYNNVT